MVVSIIFYFHPCLGNMSNLTNIFQGGWNHQLEKLCQLKNKKFRIEISKKESKQLFLVESWPPPLWKNQPEVAEKMMTIVFSFSNNVSLKKTLKKTFAATNFGAGNYFASSSSLAGMGSFSIWFLQDRNISNNRLPGPGDVWRSEKDMRGWWQLK